MVESETTVGYFCQLMVNSQEVAKIFVDYDYALYRVLGEDAPDAIWEDLGRKFGLERVCSVDLWKLVKSATNAPNAAKYYVGYPALSREDNKTKMCSGYGIAEAVKMFVNCCDTY